jgi:hypothetical protein
MKYHVIAISGITVSIPYVVIPSIPELLLSAWVKMSNTAQNIFAAVFYR